MGVPKIAAIAIVLIMASPILLGYGLNLTETTYKDYESNKDPLNVTPLLETGTAWSITKGDPYYLNDGYTSTITLPGDTNVKLMPTYTISSLKTSMPILSGYSTYANGASEVITSYSYYEIHLDYVVSPTYYASIQILDNNANLLHTFDRVTYIHFERDTNHLTVLGYYNTNYSSNSYIFDSAVPNIRYIGYYVSDGTSVSGYYNVITNSPNTYADLSAGFYYQKFSNIPWSFSTSGWNRPLPENTIDLLLTVNLDSITDSSYEFNLWTITFFKSTTGGVVKWEISVNGGPRQELYYNPSITNNTYQLYFQDTGNNGTYLTGKLQARYIGAWTKMMGEANYYQVYDFDYYISSSYGSTLNSLFIGTPGNGGARTPTIRLDGASFRGFEYPIIENQTYAPASFKTNPATTLSSIERFGSQIVFGGNTYNVTDGNITINSHKVPVQNIILDSVPNEDNTAYENRINGTVISTSATPSTITLNGKWSAIVTTVSMEEVNKTATSWTPGQFAWNGMDQNFLMAGLFTVMGVFIGLGIYAKARRLSIWPLLIVCGGAAALFLFML